VNVGLVPVDSLIPNLALMKAASWHRAQGDSVEVAWPLKAHVYDRVWRSKQFAERVLPNGKVEYPDDVTPWPCEVISGGTGYDLTTLLPPEIEACYPAYDVPGMECSYAMGRITRGCIRRCPWCCVWRQDGAVRQVATLDDFLRGQTHLRLLDDNLTAIKQIFVATCHELRERGTRTSFESLDVRLLTDEMCAALMGVKRWGNLHFAWDDTRDEAQVVAGITTLKRHYPSLHDVLVYVLIGYETDVDDWLYRCEVLRGLGAMPFAMPFDKEDRMQKRFARWVNHKAVFRSVPWGEYRDGKGHGRAAYDARKED
jgi:hypothetical protein